MYALGDWLDERWNNQHFIKRWYWRGWIIGYAIVEVLLLFFTEGIVTEIKAAARGSRIIKALAEVPVIKRFMSGAKALKETKAVRKLQETMKAVKGAETVKALGKARAWAAKALALPFDILERLTVEA